MYIYMCNQLQIQKRSSASEDLQRDPRYRREGQICSVKQGEKRESDGRGGLREGVGTTLKVV